ncbi:MAG: hypothetical protein EAZ76_01475 [Nostocales cyanobacterium]|nr:MAG: hypothetical protein EAZ87_05435 [Nostocales cyanobacterium]TAF20443.1 MAG: hypothetical protein EAZ76_01475 [Nostocales cyanobacterium]
MEYQSDNYQNELTSYKSALEKLILSILTQLLQHEDFIEEVENLIAYQLKSWEVTTYDRRDGSIEGSVTSCQIDKPCLKIKDGDFYSLEWTIDFHIIGTANIGYLTADGEDGYNPVSFSCEGNIKITFPDDFRDYFITHESVEEIIEEVVSNIKFQAEIHSATFD